jgi:hypothetical protein
LINARYAKDCPYLIAVITAAIAWSFFVLGPRPFHIYDTGWLWGDLAQVYIAWAQYTRDTSASWLISNHLSYPLSINFALFDPMPLLLLAFGWMSNFVPDHTQWFGPYFLVCLMLQGVFGYLASQTLIGQNRDPFVHFYCFVTSLFFIVAPFTFYRFVQHTALASQWVIVFSIYVSLRSRNLATRWWLLANGSAILLASGMNPYLTVMVLISQTGVALFGDRSLLLKARALRLTCMALVAITGLYTFGFTSAGGAIDWGYRIFSMNALGPFDSNGFATLFGLEIKDATGGQAWEGFVYQGLGLLLLLLIASFLFKRRNISNIESPNLKGFYASGLFVISISYALALSATLSVNAWVWPIPLHLVFEWPLSVFRASGRFFWVGSFWLILLGASVIYYKLGPRRASLLLSVLVGIQLIDVSGIGLYVRKKIGTTNRYEIEQSSIPYDLSKFSHLIVLPPWQCDTRYGPGGGRNYENLGFFSALNKLQTNNFYAGRTPASHSKFHCDPNNHLKDLSHTSLYIFSEQMFKKIAPSDQQKLSCQTNQKYEFLMCATKSIPIVN